MADETVGVVNVSSRTNGAPFDVDDLNLLVALTRRVGTAIARVRLGDGAEGPSHDVEGALQGLRSVIRARRMTSLRSSRRGFKLATALGRRLGLPEEEIEVLGYVARVHDVGMLSVGDELLRGSRRLSDEERDRLARHPQEGVRLLRPIEFAAKANEIILAHHERHDGHGYPRGLAGSDIPVGARILSVVDAFESMTVGRPYREPIPEEEAVAEIRKCAGTQFDPRVVDEFVRILAELPPPSREPADSDGAPPLAAPGRPR